MSLPPYPAYKPSGVDWLGDMPAHWEVHRLKALGKAIIGLTYSPQDVVDEAEGTLVLRASNISEGRIVYRDNVFVRCSVPDRLVTQMGDILICSRSGSRALIGKSAKIDSLSSGLTFGVFMTIFRSEHNDYLHNVFNSKLFEYQSGAFLTSTINQLTLGIFNTFKIPWPPLPEQHAIARYLDHVDRRIQRYIDTKEQLIALLQEARQATIHRAVTRGLDPDVPLNPSGVDWLGDVPAHWEVRRVKQVFRQIVGGSTPSSSEPTYWDGEIVWVTPSDVSKASRLKESQRRITQKGLDSCSTEIVPVGSLVITSRAPVGNVSLAQTPLCTNQGCKSLIPEQQVIHSEYAFRLFKILQGELQSLANGTTFTEISTTSLSNVLLPIPPFAEQCAIAAHLDKATADIDTAIDSARRQADLMRDYRASLIAHVVTGKLDVRAAAEQIDMETSHQ